MPAHKVAVMLHGRIVEYRPADEIIASPRETCARRLLEAELPVEEPSGQPTTISEAVAV